MNSTRAFAVLALGLLAAVPACEEPTTPSAPAKPPQIETVTSYVYSNDNRGLTGNDVFAFLAVSNGEFWIGSSTGIAKYADVNASSRAPDEFVNEISGLPNPLVRQMVEYNGFVYVATWGGGVGVYDVTLDTWTALRKTNNGLRNNYVADIAVVPFENRVYFATNDGVSIYNTTVKTFTSFIPPSLLDRLVSSVEAVELTGSVTRWYGPRVEDRLFPPQVPQHGITVSRSSGSFFTYTTANSGIAEPNLNDIFYDDVRGTYWVAFATKGIAEVNMPQSTWTYHTMVQGLPSNTVYSVTRADGTIWAATQGGLAKLLSSGRWQGYNRGGGLQSDRVRRVYSPDGTRLYIGFIEGGAARVKTKAAPN